MHFEGGAEQRADMDEAEDYPTLRVLLCLGLPLGAVVAITVVVLVLHV